MSHPLPPKKEVALALLERSSVHVHLDPRGAGVVVPPWFKRQPQLVLQVGLNMPVPIPDLRLDEEGLACTLSFNRSPFYCVVPWISVFAMVGDDGRGMVWPDEVPPEIAKQPRGPEAVPSREKSDPSPQLAMGKKGRVVRRGAGADGREDKSGGGAKKGKKKRGAQEPTTETRPQLVAVPPAEPSEPRHPPAARPVPAPARAPQRQPVSDPRPPRRPPSKKRELPPYLRVVK
jgi:stringent starvation protein B